jgi:hypothetical protein
MNLRQKAKLYKKQLEMQKPRTIVFDRTSLSHYRIKKRLVVPENCPAGYVNDFLSKEILKDMQDVVKERMSVQDVQEDSPFKYDSVYHAEFEFWVK